MSQTPPNPSDISRDELNQPSSPTPPQAPAPPKRRRRRWPFVILGIVLVLLILVLLAPMLASTAPVRSFIVGRINQNLNGRIAIDDWSLGWTTGTRLSGLKVYDDRNAEILDVPRVQTELTLAQIVRGRYDVGQTVVDVHNFVLHIDEKGTNFEKLAREEKRVEPAEPAREELPDVRGNITVNFRGTITSPGQPPVHVQPSTAVLDISDINQPIRNDLKLSYRVADESPGSISATGSINFAQNNRLAIERLSGQQSISLSAVNLAALAPFLQSQAEGLQLAGTAEGAVDVSLQNLTGISAQGEIVVANAAFGGAPLAGDVYRTAQATIPMKITRSEVDATTTLIRIEQLGVETPEARFAVSGQVPEQALLNLIENRPPGHEGRIETSFEATNLPAIVGQLRNALQIEPNVSIDAGTLSSRSTLQFMPDRLVLTQVAHAGASGTRDGKPITLRPVNFEATAAALPRAGQTMPDLRDIRIALKSVFATVEGGGESLAALDINSQFDLDQFRDEVGQFVDFGDLQLAGTGQARLTTTGDPTVETEPIRVQTTAQVQNLIVSGITQQPIRQDRFNLTAGGNLIREKGEFTMLRDATVAATGGDPAKPLLDLAAGADVNLRDNSLPRFELTKLNVTNLADAQQQFGAFLPALSEQQITIEGGELYVNAAGSYVGTRLTLSKPLSVSMPNLTVSRDGRQIMRREIVRANLLGTIDLPEQGINANLSQLALTTQSGLINVNLPKDRSLEVVIGADGAIRGSGAVGINADLPRLNQVARTFGGEVAVDPNAPQLRSGRLDGTVTLARAQQPITNIELAAKVTQLTVSSQQETPIQDEQVTIALRAGVPDQVQLDRPITADGEVQSTLLEATIKNGQLVTGQGTWELVQSADVQARLPDLPRFQMLLDALAPPAAQTAAATPERAPILLASFQQPPDGVRGDEPISRPRRGELAPADPAATEPLRITSGAASLTMNVRRDREKQVTTVNLTDARISQLELRRGQYQYAFDRENPIALKLAANLRTSGEEIQNIDLDADATATNFQVIDTADAAQPLFSEEKIAFRSNLTANHQRQLAQIKALTIDMASSGALRLDVKGFVEHWRRQRGGATLRASLREIEADVDYDLAKLWPIVRPLIATPDEDYGDVEIAGKYQSRFQINGPVYEGELHEAIRELQVVGALEVERFVYPGMEIQDLEIPIYLRRGELRTEYAGRPAAERFPNPAPFNGGTLNIGGWSINVAQPVPRLNIPQKHVLVSGATINPLLSDRLGKFINPIFPNSERAQGLLEIRIDHCENVALGEALRTPQSGRARMVLSITDMDIANPLGSLMLGPIIEPLSRVMGAVPFQREQAEVFQGSIRDAVITLENGRTTQDVTVQLIDPSRAPDVIAARAPIQPTVMPMRFQGDINLADLSQSIEVNLPTQFLHRFIRSERDQRTLAQIFPQGIPLSLRGTTVQPRVDVGNIAQRIVEAQIRGLIQRENGDAPGLVPGLEDLLRGRDRSRPPEPQSEPDSENG